jgi:hypothetical protein
MISCAQYGPPVQCLYAWIVVVDRAPPQDASTPSRIPGKVNSMNRRYRHRILAALLAGTAASVSAEMSAEELAKLAQNPVGNMISLPFQNNTNLNFGPDKCTQNISVRASPGSQKRLSILLSVIGATT